jgi:hypothetical protein
MSEISFLQRVLLDSGHRQGPQGPGQGPQQHGESRSSLSRVLAVMSLVCVAPMILSPMTYGILLMEVSVKKASRELGPLSERSLCLVCP